MERPPRLLETTPAGFAQDPVGRFVRSPGVVSYCFDSVFAGMAVLSPPGADDLELFRSVASSLQRMGPRFVTLLDARGWSGMSADFFVPWFGHYREVVRLAPGRLVMTALILPKKLESSALLHGVVNMEPPPWQTVRCTSLTAALRHLGVPARQGRAAEIKRITALPAAPPRQGGLALSPRQLEVAQLAAAGFSDLNIAAALGIGESTVGSHMNQVYRRLGVHSRVELTHAVGQLMGSRKKSLAG